MKGYDAAGRTTSVASSAGTTTLGYDYEGRVASISGPGVSNTFTYNGLDTRVGKVDSAGTSTYRRDGAGVTAPVLSDGGAVYTPGVSQRRSGSTTYDLSDRLGTSAKQTNSSASTTATRTYDAFGMLLASTGTPQGPFGFAASSGYQEDGDTGLKLLGHRYYDPSTGRFLSRDVARDGRNWYAYCNDNPLKAVDVDGRKPQAPWTEVGKLTGKIVISAVSVILVVPTLVGLGLGARQAIQDANDSTAYQRKVQDFPWKDPETGNQLLQNEQGKNGLAVVARAWSLGWQYLWGPLGGS